jgi:hypothetical protein
VHVDRDADERVTHEEFDLQHVAILRTGNEPNFDGLRVVRLPEVVRQ